MVAHRKHIDSDDADNGKIAVRFTQEDWEYILAAKRELNCSKGAAIRRLFMNENFFPSITEADKEAAKSLFKSKSESKPK
jgi:hypothetical protein